MNALREVDSKKALSQLESWNNHVAYSELTKQNYIFHYYCHWTLDSKWKEEFQLIEPLSCVEQMKFR